MAFIPRDPKRVLTVIGVDCGFSDIGWCILNAVSEIPIDGGVIRTEKSSKKANMLSTDDNRRRAFEIHRALAAVHAIASNNGRTLLAYGYESESLVRNAGVTFKMGIGFGVLYSSMCAAEAPVLTLSPSDLKLFLCKKKTAFKEEVGEAVRARYAADAIACATIDRIAKALPVGKHEHLFDAIAAGLYACNSDVVKTMVRQQ